MNPRTLVIAWSFLHTGFSTSLLKQFLWDDLEKFYLECANHYHEKGFTSVSFMMCNEYKDLCISRKGCLPQSYSLDQQLHLFECKETLSNSAFGQIDYDNAIKLLQQEYEKNGNIELCEQAIEKFKAGNVVDGVKLSHSTQYKVARVYKNTYDVMQQALKEGEMYKVGIPEFDAEGGIEFGTLMPLTGASGSMKTSISLYLIRRLLETNPSMRACYFEKEMAATTLGKRFNAMITRTTVGDMLRNPTLTEQKLAEAKEINNPTFEAIQRIQIIPNDSFANASDIYNIVRSEKPRVWAIDYIDLILVGRDKGMAMVETIQLLKQLAIDTMSLGIILTQMNKGTTPIEDRKNKIPIIHDIPFGTEIERLSTSLFTLFRPSQYYPVKYPLDKMAYLIGKKNRDGSFLDVYLKTDNEYYDFHLPNEDEKRRAKSWLKDYQQGVLEK
jgi:replicative DNA helicase